MIKVCDNNLYSLAVVHTLCQHSANFSFLHLPPGGVRFSSGDYGAGCLHTGTNFSSPWLWCSLFSSSVSNHPTKRVACHSDIWPLEPPSHPTHHFSDALREVQKYSHPEPMQDAKVNPNVYDHVHMKLFRSQRNLYISGFSLFLWLSVVTQTSSNTLLTVQKQH